MKNPFKKIFDMEDKDPNAPDQEVLEAMEEMAKNDESEAENDQNEAKLQALEKQLEENRHKYLYLFSDFENYKRNAARERVELITSAGRDILAALLPVLDDFDRAAKNGALSEGTALIHQKLANTLRAKGLKPTETQAGDDFNADLHEAIAEVPAASEDLKGKIVDIIEPGYTLGERVLRFAKVVVGR
jgi:molecular chaperone GrpE